MAVVVHQPVLFVQDLAVALAEQIDLSPELTLARIESLGIDPDQTDERVAGQDVEVDIGQRLQLLDGLRRGHQGEEQAQLGDLGRLFHDVHAEQVVGDDACA